MANVEVAFDNNEIANNTQIILNASAQTEANFLKEEYKIILNTAKDFIEKY